MGKMKAYAMDQEEMVYNALQQDVASYQFFEDFASHVFSEYGKTYVTDQDYIGQVAEIIWSETGKGF